MLSPASVLTRTLRGHRVCLSVSRGSVGSLPATYQDLCSHTLQVLISESSPGQKLKSSCDIWAGVSQRVHPGYSDEPVRAARAKGLTLKAFGGGSGPAFLLGLLVDPSAGRWMLQGRPPLRPRSRIHPCPRLRGTASLGRSHHFHTRRVPFSLWTASQTGALACL